MTKRQPPTTTSNQIQNQALSAAIEAGDFDSAMQARAAGANIKDIIVSPLKESFTQEQVATQTAALFAAIAEKDFAGAKKAIDSGANIEARNEKSRPPLVQSRFTPNIMLLLLARGADIKTQTPDGWQIINWTSIADTIGFLVDAGANPDHRDGNGLGAAHFAENPASIDALAKCGADINLRTYNGQTPTMMAESLEILEATVRHGGKLDARDKKGRTALMLIDYPQGIEFLINKGANANAKDRQGNTALMHAKNVECAKMLLQHGADINARNRKGETPLIMATKANNIDMVRALISAGEELELDLDIDAMDNKGNTASMLSDSYPTLFKELERAGASSRKDMQARYKQMKQMKLEAKKPETPQKSSTRTKQLWERVKYILTTRQPKTNPSTPKNRHGNKLENTRTHG